MQSYLKKRADIYLKDWGKFQKNPPVFAAVIIRELLEEVAKAQAAGRAQGFIQGQAWACAIALRHEMGADELVDQSSLTIKEMKQADVIPHDVKPIAAFLRHKERVKAYDCRTGGSYPRTPKYWRM